MVFVFGFRWSQHIETSSRELQSTGFSPRFRNFQPRVTAFFANLVHGNPQHTRVRFDLELHHEFVVMCVWQ